MQRLLERSVELDDLKAVEAIVSTNKDILDLGKALNIACECGHLEIVKYLVENGADVHYKEDDPVFIAGESNHLNIVKYLHNKGANIHVINESTLRVASMEGLFDIVEYLVEHGADIQAEDYDSVKYATICGHSRLVEYFFKYMIEHGLNTTKCVKECIEIAEAKGYDQIVTFLKSEIPKLEEKKKKNEIAKNMFVVTINDIKFKFSPYVDDGESTTRPVKRVKLVVEKEITDPAGGGECQAPEYYF